MLFLCIILLVGCSSPPLQEKKIDNLIQIPTINNEITAPIKTTKHKLYSQFYEWQDVRYKLGGLSKQGVDCSGFVHLTYKSKLGVKLPRTTRLQAKLGRDIAKNELTAGDLVFFKTGSVTRHVGIYLENNKFLHASASRGVMISKLDNVYWRANYWKSIRL